MQPDRPIAKWLSPLRSAARGARRAGLKLRVPGTFTAGKDFAIGRRSAILCPDFFEAGERVHIGQDFLCEVNARIGNDVLISSFVRFIGNDHLFDEAGVTVFSSTRAATACQVLEGDNLIGNGTIVLGNVTIGRGVIVGAGSLVTRDLPPNWICLGRPAKPVRKRFPDLNGQPIVCQHEGGR